MIRSFSWDQYFMTLAYLVSMKSKDPSTRVGAVIVGPDHEIRATGYNGLPRGVADRNYRYEDREYKLLAINHAEENAILHCALNGISAKGCTLYSPWLPCSRCTKTIIQSGISEIVYDENFPGNRDGSKRDWERSLQISHEMLVEAGVHVRPFNDKTIRIAGLYGGQKFELDSIDKPEVE